MMTRCSEELAPRVGSFFPWLARVLYPYVQYPFPSKSGGILGIVNPPSVASCGPGGCSKHPEGGGSSVLHSGRDTFIEQLGDWDGHHSGSGSERNGEHTQAGTQGICISLTHTSRHTGADACVSADV